MKPVTCNGKAKGVARRPFLSPPFKGWTSIVSYFDHDSPDFSRDGTVIAATGLEAQPDPHHQATDFPAYWNDSIRQYIYYDGHNGYDFNLSYRPVYAAAAGKVIFARFEYPDAPDHGYGKMVMISHPAGYVSLYGHFDQIRVKKGQRVKRGQLLGISGNTGHSTGPHLHFTVFHNCTPTDPYGWTGSGQDPLAGYENETSEYLWTHPPLVFNPLPGMPGTSQLPKTSARRILLLRLPSTNGGTFAFVRDLKAEMNRVRRDLGDRGVKADLLLGGLTITTNTSASRLYRLPDVASIAAPYVASDDQSDILAALARAALVNPRRSLHFGGGKGWSGYLFTWQGRTLLLGRGPKDQQVTLRLTSSNRRSTTRKLLTDPSTGAYAIDLGGLSSSQRTALKRQLQAKSAKSSLTFQRARNSASTLEKPKSGAFDSRAILVSLLVVTVVAGVVLFRRFPSPNRPA